MLTHDWSIDWPFYAIGGAWSLMILVLGFRWQRAMTPRRWGIMIALVFSWAVFMVAGQDLFHWPPYSNDPYWSAPNR